MKKYLLIALLFCAPIYAKDPNLLSSDPVHSTAYEASHILKSSGGTLISLVGYNSGGAQFIQLHNSSTLPANATVPMLVFAVAATSNFSLDVPITGLQMGDGIVVCNSSTGPAKTLGGNDCFFFAQVR